MKNPIINNENNITMKDEQFDDIRPYRNNEIAAAMQRIADSSSLPLLAAYVYPDDPIEIVQQRIAGYKTIKEFQSETMSMVNQQVLRRSMRSFSCNGLEQLSKQKAYLYVSNHRDIMLDASLLQYFLDSKGYETTEITFGANLMSNPLVIDIGKSNKMFRVERPGKSFKEFYRQSHHLSEYIRYVITERKESVWIAQRNGRTKDGNDMTDQGIIKMFCMSKESDKIAALTELNIVPMAISYEWEPCDILKTLELYESRLARYTKKPGEDLNSILTGIIQPKGNVHIELCKPVEPAELQQFSDFTNNEYNKAVARLLDKRIHEAYRLYPNNYIAHDLRHGSDKYAGYYTARERDDFRKQLRKLEQYDNYDIDRLMDIFLGIYSNPVDNKTKWS